MLLFDTKRASAVQVHHILAAEPVPADTECTAECTDIGAGVAVLFDIQPCADPDGQELKQMVVDK